MIKELIAQNAACNAVVDLVDTGTDYSSGYLGIYDSTVLLAALNFSNPAFMDATNGKATAYPMSDSTVLTDGTADSFKVFNRDSTSIWSGSVVSLTEVGELKLNNTVMIKDSTVSLTYGSYTVPA